MISIYEQLDALHIEITFFDSDGLDWCWHNTDTGERSDWTCASSREALFRTAEDFNIVIPEDDIDDSMDGDHDSAMASAGFGMDEDYGSFHDHLEAMCDEPYYPEPIDDTDYS